MVTKLTVLQNLRKSTTMIQKGCNRRYGSWKIVQFLWSLVKTELFGSIFLNCWSVHQQSASLQLKWILCAQVLHFQQLQWSHHRVQENFALRNHDYEKTPYENMDIPLSEPNFTRRKKMVGRHDGFILYGKLGFDWLFLRFFQIWN